MFPKIPAMFSSIARKTPGFELPVITKSLEGPVNFWTRRSLAAEREAIFLPRCFFKWGREGITEQDQGTITRHAGPDRPQWITTADHPGHHHRQAANLNSLASAGFFFLVKVKTSTAPGSFNHGQIGQLSTNSHHRIITEQDQDTITRHTGPDWLHRITNE